MIKSPFFAGKKYAVLGLARSGLATVQALAESGASILAWDNRKEARDNASQWAQIGDIMTADLSGFHAIVVSPGVPLNSHPITEKSKEFCVPIIGDIELFAQARPSLPPHRIVGITGTNGKSTTTALVHHIIENAGFPVRMGGNIGLPIMLQEPLPAGGIYVLELSSYQIDLTHTLSCDVAALINLSPDHLDRYDGYQGYIASKERLFAMQSPDAFSILGNGDNDTLQVYERVISHRGPLKVILADGSVREDQSDWPSLQGPHNMQNIAIAGGICKALGISEPQWRSALPSFRGLEHRLERVAEIDGVLYINDSKATNPESVAPALAAYKNIHWIVGGIPKSDNLKICEPNYHNVKKAYTIGEAGAALTKELGQHMPVDASELLANAVMRASKEAVSGDVILLSPACASFDQFRDFEARGDCFKAAVENVASESGQVKLPSNSNG